ncbi:SET domain-containing protein [Thiocystis violacea]|uniref:SET domain-containing protein n=1 Tax=Thiocystis violacea TaxID=13725 RepID=UPI001907F74E|nr:SET domain-containing protein-lysine N-methyltransferase [Thiocystis violacea]MBK1720651.1 SET domain-containing protein-lysine N-methyltransferase [Thiocystis violacea]
MGARSWTSTLGARVYSAPSPIHGRGCFAKVSFAPGDFIGTYEGPRVEEDGSHVLWVYDADRDRLTGRQGSNLLRWVNHCECPNAEFDGFDLYAKVVIAMDEEITCDYGAAL